MKKRTFIRIMLDILFINNALCKALVSLVNFCKEQYGYRIEKLKFLEKMPLNRKEDVNNYSKKFLFQTTKVHGVNIR